MIKTKVIFLTETVANGTAAATFTDTITIPSGYEVEAWGVDHRSGTDNFDVGVRDGNNVYSDVVTENLYLISSNPEPNKRLFDMPMAGNGNVLDITYTLLANAASDNTITFVFKLKRTDDSCDY